MTWLLGTRIGRLISAALAGVLAVLGAFVAGVLRGGSRAKARAQEDDYENAADIRDRVDRNLDNSLRKYEDAGFRNGE